MSRSRLTYARVCVEIGVDAPRPEVVDVYVNGNCYQQAIQYEWRPDSCPGCNSFGHDKSQGPKLVAPTFLPRQPPSASLKKSLVSARLRSMTSLSEIG